MSIIGIHKHLFGESHTVPCRQTQRGQQLAYRDREDKSLEMQGTKVEVAAHCGRAWTAVKVLFFHFWLILLP
jgi:hypothetical protein